jgi:hypothetical protein
MQRAVRGSNHNLVAVCTTARPSIKAAAAAAALLTMTGGTVAAKSLLTGVEESQLRLNNMAFSNPRLQPSIVILAEAPGHALVACSSTWRPADALSRPGPGAPPLRLQPNGRATQSRGVLLSCLSSHSRPSHLVANPFSSRQVPLHRLCTLPS